VGGQPGLVWRSDGKWRVFAITEQERFFVFLSGVLRNEGRVFWVAGKPKPQRLRRVCVRSSLCGFL